MIALNFCQNYAEFDGENRRFPKLIQPNSAFLSVDLSCFLEFLKRISYIHSPFIALIWRNIASILALILHKINNEILALILQKFLFNLSAILQ